MFRRQPISGSARSRRLLHATPVERHPLSDSLSDPPTNLRPKRQSRDVDAAVAPLSQLWDGQDPLTLLAQEQGVGDEDVSLHVITWQNVRTSLLQTASSGVTVRSLVTVCSHSFDTDPALSLHVHAGGSWRLAQVALAERIRTTDSRSSHVELFAFLKQMKCEVRAAWVSESRVRALKLVIQCCKLLESVVVPLLYPAIFYQVSDLLDMFGSLVYERLMSLNGGTVGSQTRALSTALNDSAAETALNWFYKVSTIKELVPRLYVETALLRCFELLWPQGFDTSVERLSQAANGVFQPLVAAYLRCYLCRVSGPSVTVLGDFVARLPADVVAGCSSTASSSCTLSVVVDGELRLLLWPPLLWCVHGGLAAACGPARPALEERLLARAQQPGSGSLLLLLCLLHALEGSRAPVVRWAVLGRACTEAVLRQQESRLAYQLCERLLVRLAELVDSTCRVSGEQTRSLLASVWTAMQTLSPEAYVRCAAAWVGLVVSCMKPRRVALVLDDVVEHVGRIPPLDRCDGLVERVVEELLSQAASSPYLLSLPSLSTLLECLQEPQARLRLHVLALSALSRRLENQDTGDSSLLADTGLALSHTVADCCALMGSGESREGAERAVAQLVRAVWRLQLLSDPAGALDLLVEVRRGLFSMQSVLEQLVLLACSLLVGRDPRGPQAPVLAFCFVTAARVDCGVRRVRLFSLLAALSVCGPVSHTLAFAEAAVRSLSELPNTHTSLTAGLAATLMQPALGTHRPALIRHLLDVVLTSAAFHQPSSAACVRVLTVILTLISAASSEEETEVDWTHQLGADVLTSALHVLTSAYSSASHLSAADARAASSLMLLLISVCDRKWPGIVHTVYRLYDMCSPCVQVKPQLLNCVREWLDSAVSDELCS